MAHDISKEDLNFVLKAGPMGLAEVAIGEMARSQSNRPDIQQFAERLIQDHTSNNKQLAVLVQRKGIDAPTGPDLEHQRLHERLSRLRGTDFDKEFVRAQVRDHEQVVALFEREAMDGHDRDLREFAQKSMGLMQSHLQMAREMSSVVGK